MKKLILTALDNNDSIWYRCFIPFILSLRQTDYSGDIGVINYQLSLEKQEILKSNGIIIFEAENKFSEILIDRHYTASIISQNYDYSAFYDADIWFSYKELTIFEQVKDNQSLYCCYDVIHPPFLMQSLPDNLLETTHRKFQKLVKVQQYVWQAGLIVGSKQAWENYHNYIEYDLFSLTEFKMLYGVDATVLNLYACDTNQVKHLSEKYNCLPYWGMKLVNSSFQDYFCYQNEPVEAIHITRYHRNSKDYNFTYLNQKIYLNEGKQFSINSKKIDHYTDCGKLFSSLPQYATQSLTIEQLSCSYLFANVDSQGITYQLNDILFDISSISSCTLRNLNNHSVDLHFCFQETLNKRFPLIFQCYVNDKLLNLERNKIYSICLNPLDKLVLITNDIWQEGGVRYVFRNVKLV